MNSYRIASIALISVVSAGLGLGVGCGADENNSSAADGTSFCGNNQTEAGEECDDANTSDNDDCLNNCTLPVCGDGIQSGTEQCDDGNSDNSDGCTNTCKDVDCNINGVVEDGEECDDNNNIPDDGCTNFCTEPECGDGVVQEGEDCDDGNNEINDNCPNDCLNPSTASSGGDPCQGQATYGGMVTNDQNPTQTGTGVPAVWAYGGDIGIKAGNEMCAAIGADHVCSYAEVIAADAAGELSSVPADTEFWVNRLVLSVPQINGAGMSPPGAGGRCNEWQYPTNHIADGEYGTYLPAGSTPANAARVGNIDFFFDDDTAYTGNAGDGHQCSGMPGSPNPGCASDCGGATPKAILCCFPVCE